MSKKKEWGPYIVLAVIFLCPVLISSFCGGCDNSDGIPAEKKEQSTPRDTGKRIEAAKAELDKIKEQRAGKDGKPGKLKLTDVTKPEVVLPPVLALLGDELGYYGINNEELTKQIQSDPEKFRAAVPEHGRKRFLILTPAHEKLIGDKLDSELAAEGKIYHDEAQEARVRRIAEKIIAQLPEPVPLRLFLIKDDSINAFCLPNGSVYVHSGLLERVGSDDELAFVIAHEYAHLAARHSNESASKLIFLMAGDVLAEDKANKLEKEGKSGRGNLLRGCYLGGGIVGALLPFSRMMENEADTLGICYMARAGYDPRGALAFFRRMKSANPKDDPGWVKLLSTHPSDEKRLKRMQKEYDAIKGGTPRKGILRRLMKKKEPARQEKEEAPRDESKKEGSVLKDD